MLPLLFWEEHAVYRKRPGIRDADRRRRLRSDEFVAVWVRQTRDVAFEAEDALNDFLRHDLLARVRQIRKRLEKISANRAAYHIEHAASPAWAVSSATTLAAWRYLVVVDGSIAVADWNSLRASLLDEGNGSRVALVTDAAGLEVVGYAGGLTYDPIELTRLSPENTPGKQRRRRTGHPCTTSLPSGNLPQESASAISYRL
ncbi:uncharacterized protein [Triticum aestivum]|uniref:uncharacterized protein isoform X2 n=1 Tax=Triticum aestivum TaxID=4565 RepID=UPI001D016FC0|nr:uncharacterized protein LOC123161794 isoform X2 [Triticum aestivum]